MVKLVIPDASVLLKWVLPEEREPHAEKALAIRDAFAAGDLQLLVPPLWFYEVGNVLTSHFPESADDRLSALVAFDIPEAVPHAAWRASIVILAARHHASFYDASYHALALVSGGTFVTADEKYVRKVGSDAHVLKLADWTA